MDCGDFSHALLDLNSQQAFDDVIVVKASIVSIDKDNNQANVMYMTAGNDSLPTEAIDFFYHCEEADGSEEDLAEGYKAFETDDEVYIFHIPSGGENGEDATYIIGHVDINSIKLCAGGDILEFRHSTYVTLYSVKKEAVFDLEGHTERGNANKPTEFPCDYDSDYLNWRSENFYTPVAATIVSYDLDVKNNYHTIAESFDSTEYEQGEDDEAGWDVHPDDWETTFPRPAYNFFDTKTETYVATAFNSILSGNNAISDYSDILTHEATSVTSIYQNVPGIYEFDITREIDTGSAASWIITDSISEEEEDATKTISLSMKYLETLIGSSGSGARFDKTVERNTECIFDKSGLEEKSFISMPPFETEYYASWAPYSYNYVGGTGDLRYPFGYSADAVSIDSEDKFDIVLSTASIWTPSDSVVGQDGFYKLFGAVQEIGYNSDLYNTFYPLYFVQLMFGETITPLGPYTVPFVYNNTTGLTLNETILLVFPFTIITLFKNMDAELVNKVVDEESLDGYTSIFDCIAAAKDEPLPPSSIPDYVADKNGVQETIYDLLTASYDDYGFSDTTNGSVVTPTLSVFREKENEDE